MSHTATLKRVGLPTMGTLVARIVRTFDAASPATLEAGARWYDEAGTLAATLADDVWTPPQVACIIAHLSPRTSWERNISGATAFIASGPAAARSLGCIGDNVARAERVASAPADPFSTFGPTAPKTLNFARNIDGDREAVTVDVWAARVVSVDEAELKRAGVYDALAHAYRLAARRRGVDPATMQATTWIVARNGRAA